MRYRPRLDSTQRAIVEALRACGCTVVSLAGVGAGVPDLLCGVGGRTILLEVKSPKKVHRRATEMQATQDRWMERWRGGEVFVVHDVPSAMLACRL